MCIYCRFKSFHRLRVIHITLTFCDRNESKIPDINQRIRLLFMNVGSNSWVGLHYLVLVARFIDLLILKDTRNNR